jgi:hypothetical protein
MAGISYFMLNHTPFTLMSMTRSKVARQSASQADDLAALGFDVMVDDDGVGKPSPVEVAVDLSHSHGFSVPASKSLDGAAPPRHSVEAQGQIVRIS